MKGKEAEYVIPLGRIYSSRRTGRAARAIRYIREWVKKRTRAEEVIIDSELNKAVWSRGIEKPPRRVPVKIVVEETRELKTSKGETLVLPRKVIVYLKGSKSEQGGEEKGEKAS